MVQSYFSCFTREEMEARLREARIAYGTVNDVAGLSQHAALRRWTIDSETGAGADAGASRCGAQAAAIAAPGPWRARPGDSGRVLLVIGLGNAALRQPLSKPVGCR